MELGIINSEVKLNGLSSVHGKVVPIEVKSGNTRANSLKSIMKNNKDISYGYKFIDENIGTSEEGIITLPLYMIAFFDKVSE